MELCTAKVATEGSSSTSPHQTPSTLPSLIKHHSNQSDGSVNDGVCIAILQSGMNESSDDETNDDNDFLLHSRFSQ